MMNGHNCKNFGPNYPNVHKATSFILRQQKSLFMLKGKKAGKGVHNCGHAYHNTH